MATGEAVPVQQALQSQSPDRAEERGRSRTRHDRRRGSDNLRSSLYSRGSAALDSREISALHSRETTADGDTREISALHSRETTADGDRCAGYYLRHPFERFSATCDVFFLFSAACLARCVMACEAGSAPAAAPSSAAAPQRGENGLKTLHLATSKGHICPFMAATSRGPSLDTFGPAS